MSKTTWRSSVIDNDNNHLHDDDDDESITKHLQPIITLFKQQEQQSLHGEKQTSPTSISSCSEIFSRSSSSNNKNSFRKHKFHPKNVDYSLFHIMMKWIIPSFLLYFHVLTLIELFRYYDSNSSHDHIIHQQQQQQHHSTNSNFYPSQGLWINPSHVNDEDTLGNTSHQVHTRSRRRHMSEFMSWLLSGSTFGTTTRTINFFVWAHPTTTTTRRLPQHHDVDDVFHEQSALESCTLSLERWTQLTQFHDFKFTPNLYGTWRLTHSTETAPPSSMGSYVKQDPMPCPDMIEFTSISVSASLYRETYFGISIEAIFNQTNFRTDLWAMVFQPRFSPVFFEMFAHVRPSLENNEVQVLNQELISNETLRDGSYKILQMGSSQRMQPLLIRKKVFGFQVTFQMKLEYLFMTREVNTTNVMNVTSDSVQDLSALSNKPSLRTFLLSNTRELPNKIESKLRFKLLYSKYQAPFTYPVQVMAPYGTNSLFFDGVFSLNDVAQDDTLLLQKRVPVANNAISTIIVILNGVVALCVLTLLICFRNTEPRASRGYLPYVIFIQVLINFAKDFVQSFFGEEYLLIAFVFGTLSILSFSYLMYLLNTLLFFYKRKVYHDVYQKMKRDSLLDHQKSSNASSIEKLLATEHGGSSTPVNNSLNNISHDNKKNTPDTSNNDGMNPSNGMETAHPTRTEDNSTPMKQQAENGTNSNTLVMENDSAVHKTTSQPRVSNLSMSGGSLDSAAEKSVTSLKWIKSRKVRTGMTIGVIFVVLLSLSAIIPILLLTNVINVLLAIYIILGFLVAIGSVLVIGSLSLDMMWNWKRLFEKCEWKAYFFRNDPLYYRMELVIHVFTALFYLALAISLLIQRDRVDNLPLLASQTYGGVVPVATFVSLPLECLAVFFEIMAAGGGFICIMTVYEKIRLSNQDSTMTSDLISVYDTPSQADPQEQAPEFPASAQLEKKSSSMPKLRANMSSPLMELLGDDLSRLFIDEKGYELLRLYSKSEFSIENVAFINDIEKIYSQLFCEIERNSLKQQRRGSGGSTPSSSMRLIKPTLKQNLPRETLDSIHKTLSHDFYDLYVSDQAKLSVNFSFQSKVIFNKWRQQGLWSDEYVKSDDFTNDMDFIALDVVRNLRDTFRRFQLTQSYKDWKIQARKQHALLRSALKAKKSSTLAVVVVTEDNQGGGTNNGNNNNNNNTMMNHNSTPTMVELDLGVVPEEEKRNSGTDAENTLVVSSNVV
ncbi:hypothetical protein C9374_010641 [Naegleria lovaniensis]|uniref:RGS domain-containing protein n=1 Tax=Naegleria lovaniensis TaxID=51637 RepID=A0AA88GFF9_NAELO|nr:uncharacterized protein C9374_010641 [Naegleria lovaniensis]KAG2374622.1 hypothetical protein C9374_010641 [Naegleria lovaniensis]